MQFLSILSAAALLATANAAAAGVEKDFQIRLWSTPNCSKEGSQGNLSIYDDKFKNGQCIPLDKAYSAVSLTTSKPGCEITFWRFLNCQGDYTQLSTSGKCETNQWNYYQAYTIECEGHA